MRYTVVNVKKEKTPMKIILKERNETVDYAASELKKYITVMSRGKISPEVTSETACAEEGIILATLSALSLDVSDLEDAFTDDIIDINVKDGVGYIAGSNNRSILMGVYKYCASLGCRYLRPGPDGDYIPKADVENHTFKYRKKADSPIRCEIVEGCVSYEHCRDTVYYLPKIGMNAYMIEGLVPYSYMHKWYGHVGNVNLRKSGQVTDYEMLEEYTALLQKDIKLLGLQLHTLGHAWMTGKLGIRLGTTAEQEASLTEENRKYLALVGGKRGLFHGSQFYTQFCYSNPEARKILADTVVEYAISHPHVDYVHLWLADSQNNWCECEGCRNTEPSDHYVKLLNEIDDALTERGLNTRIVMIMYVETVRPPKKELLKNPKRFIMTVAIGSLYDEGYGKVKCEKEIPPYKLNDFKMFDAEQRFMCHEEWKRLMQGMRSAIFEYRFYMDHYCDLGYMRIARETHRDMKALELVDMQGCMTDKTHRNYMPTALPVIMMGETLFDKNLDYEKVTNEYFEGAFGKDGAKCRDYLEKLSELLSPSNFRRDAELDIEEAGVGQAISKSRSWKNNPEVAKKAKEIPGVIDSFIPIINENISSATNNAQMDSWIYLRYHADICKLFSYLLLKGALGDIPGAQDAYFELERYIGAHELEFHRTFDGFLFLRSLRRKIGLPAVGYYE